MSSGIFKSCILAHRFGCFKNADSWAWSQTHFLKTSRFVLCRQALPGKCRHPGARESPSSSLGAPRSVSLALSSILSHKTLCYLNVPGESPSFSPWHPFPPQTCTLSSHPPPHYSLHGRSNPFLSSRSEQAGTSPPATAGAGALSGYDILLPVGGPVVPLSLIISLQSATSGPGGPSQTQNEPVHILLKRKPKSSLQLCHAE